MARIELKVPDLGDVKDASVIEVMVKVGQEIRAEQSLITLESDKASMEVPASASGVIQELRVRVGDRASEGTVIAILESAVASPDGSAAPGASSPSQSPSPSPAASLAAAPQASLAAPVPVPAPVVPFVPLVPAAPTAVAHASPSVRRMATELGVDIASVRGTGPKGRVTHEDVQSHVRGIVQSVSAAGARVPQSGQASDWAGVPLPAWPQVDFTKFGEVERKPLSRIQKLSGANLHRNWVRIPHVTNHEEADITSLEALRVQLNGEKDARGVKYTLLAFLLKASASCLRQFPQFNASLDGEDLVLKHYIHIGFAADTPQGLVVPVIRHVDTKSVSELALEAASLAAKAREGKLAASEMQGGCFSISSLGGFGGTTFTPIINAPEVAILGVCRASMKPVWNGSSFEPRLILPLSLSYDHRVIDGAAAARFNAHLAKLLGDFRRVLI